MANSYYNIFLHIVFAVKYRAAQIPLSNTDKIYRYIGGVINNIDKCRVIKIGGISDHIHILCRMSPNVPISEFIKTIKVASTKYINENYLAGKARFAWQRGYGCFSVSKSHTDAVEYYIENQIEHHHGISFIEEFKRLLDKNGIDYNEGYIFTDME